MTGTLMTGVTPRSSSLAMAISLILAGSSMTVSAQDQNERIDRLESRLNAMADALEEQRSSGTDDRFSVGGYGELHYNNLENDATGAKKKELDFHRFVVDFAYEYTDDIRFFSEVELEHALADGKKGEVELEQAYVEFDLNEQHRAKGGVFLVPVGILNETHEPPTFYGVERNPVEKRIIPTTWWAAGGMLSGELGSSGFSYDAGVHEGLLTQDAVIRDGRQKSAKANAANLAYTGRLKYTGTLGLEVAGTLQYQSDLSQDLTGANKTEDATLFSGHAIWSRGPFEFRGLYAVWNVNGDNLDSDQETQQGGYAEASYRLINNLGVFVRQSNTQYWDGSNGRDVDQTSIGVNYWPHPDVALKFDIQRESADNDANAADGFNAGIGYQF